MYNLRNLALLSGAAAAALIAWACDRPSMTAGPELGTPSFWEGCPAGRKFTGGGRIDPSGEKVTFGFNVHANDACRPIKGQLQVVHHPTQTKYHSTEIFEFESYSAEQYGEPGECGHWNGTVRAKHGNGPWHPHDFDVEACDNGEPGSSPGTGPDTFSITISGGDDSGEPGHGSTGRTPLTGGNIQAH